MKERIKDKIKQIETFLQELSEIKPTSFEEYLSNFEKRAACERYAEKIPEATVDLAILFIRYKQLSLPKDDKSTFDILSKNKIIAEELSKNLQDSKGMRNVIAHEYGKIDDEIVFDAIENELEKDVVEFIKIIKEQIK